MIKNGKTTMTLNKFVSKWILTSQSHLKGLLWKRIWNEILCFQNSKASFAICLSFAFFFYWIPITIMFEHCTTRTKSIVFKCSFRSFIQILFGNLSIRPRGFGWQISSQFLFKILFHSKQTKFRGKQIRYLTFILLHILTTHF